MGVRWAKRRYPTRSQPCGPLGWCCPQVVDRFVDGLGGLWVVFVCLWYPAATPVGVGLELSCLGCSLPPYSPPFPLRYRRVTCNGLVVCDG